MRAIKPNRLMSGELLPADWRAVGFVSSQLQLREASFSFNEGVEMERGFSQLCWGGGGGGGGGEGSSVPRYG